MSQKLPNDQSLITLISPEKTVKSDFVLKRILQTKKEILIFILHFTMYKNIMAFSFPLYCLQNSRFFWENKIKYASLMLK